MGKGKLKVQFLSFSLPLELTDFNLFLAFFQGVNLKRRRRKKTVYTKEHLDMLEDVSWENRWPSWRERSHIAKKLNVGEDRILV